MSDSSVLNFTCKACGAQLSIPNNPKGSVFCEYCGAENYITGVVKNGEIKKKNDINSGIPLFLNDAKIQKMLLKALSENVYSSHDMYQKISVLKVEKCIIPAYYIYCNGTMNFSYDQGIKKTRQKVVKRGSENVIVNENYTEWLPYQSSISESKGFIAPANQEWADLTVRFYQNLNPTLLVDIEKLEYPTDVITYDNDLPAASSVNQYLLPTMKDILLGKAKNSLLGRETKNFKSNGENIQKEPETRVFLSFYCVKFEYERQMYRCIISNNGELIDCDRLPSDEVRVAAIQAKQHELKECKPKNALFIALIAVSAVLAAVFLSVHWALTVFLALPGLGVSIYFNMKKVKENNAVKAGVQAELDYMMDTIPRAYRAFITEKQALSGLEHLSGNPDAF